MIEVFNKSGVKHKIFQEEDIEYGYNENGHYLKYSNGLLICWNSVACKAGESYTYWTFPHAFANDNYISFCQHSWATDPYGFTVFGSSTKYGGNVHVKDETNGISNERSGKILVLGRWK